MTKTRNTLVALAGLALALLMLASPASANPGAGTDAKKAAAPLAQLAPVPVPTTTDPLVIEPTVHPPGAKKAGGFTTMSTATDGPYIQATAYQDAYFAGGIVQKLVANYGPCDSTGYKWTMTAWNSNGITGPVKSGSLVSSYRNTRGIGSGCNRVTVVAYNGSVYSSCVYSNTLDHMGDPWNDRTASYAVRHDTGCPSVG